MGNRNNCESKLSPDGTSFKRLRETSLKASPFLIPKRYLVRFHVLLRLWEAIAPLIKNPNKLTGQWRGIKRFSQA